MKMSRLLSILFFLSGFWGSLQSAARGSIERKTSVEELKRSITLVHKKICSGEGETGLRSLAEEIGLFGSMLERQAAECSDEHPSDQQVCELLLQVVRLVSPQSYSQKQTIFDRIDFNFFIADALFPLLKFVTKKVIEAHTAPALPKVFDQLCKEYKIARTGHPDLFEIEESIIDSAHISMEIDGAWLFLKRYVATRKSEGYDDDDRAAGDRPHVAAAAHADDSSDYFLFAGDESLLRESLQSDREAADALAKILEKEACERERSATYESELSSRLISPSNASQVSYSSRDRTYSGGSGFSTPETVSEGRRTTPVVTTAPSAEDEAAGMMF